MIDVRELRIDNLVYQKRGGLRPHAINLSDFSKGAEHFDNFSPIPLTEEILLKCGFDENMVLTTESGELRCYGNGRIDVGGYDSYTLGMVFITECNSLHQLQNLFFALTDKELDVQPETLNIKE